MVIEEGNIGVNGIVLTDVLVLTADSLVKILLAERKEKRITLIWNLNKYK